MTYLPTSSTTDHRPGVDHRPSDETGTPSGAALLLTLILTALGGLAMVLTACYLALAR